MDNHCYNCAAKNECSAAVEYGSIICMANRLRSGQTKASFINGTKGEVRYCSYCGKPLKVIGSQRFCNNVQCLNRYKEV